ncbi:MAG: cyanase, partial [Stellaceae bacterium]
MTRAQLTEKIAGIVRKKGLKWRDISAKIGPGSPVYYTAALHGQMKLSKPEAETAGKLLGLDEDEILLLQDIP